MSGFFYILSAPFGDLFGGVYLVAFLADCQGDNSASIILFKADISIDSFGEESGF